MKMYSYSLEQSNYILYIPLDTSRIPCSPQGYEIYVSIKIYNVILDYMHTLFSDTGLRRSIVVIMCTHKWRQLLTKHFVDSHILNCVYRMMQWNYCILSNWCDEKWAEIIETKLDMFYNPFRHYRVTNILPLRKNHNYKKMSVGSIL